MLSTLWDFLEVLEQNHSSEARVLEQNHSSEASQHYLDQEDIHFSALTNFAHWGPINCYVRGIVMSFCFTDIVSFTTHDSTITKILLPTHEGYHKRVFECQQASLSPWGQDEAVARIWATASPRIDAFPELMLTQPWLGDLETTDIQESGAISQMSSHERAT